MSNEQAANAQAEIEDEAIDAATEEQTSAEAMADVELDVASLQQELESAQKQANDNWDKALRIQAEMENLKRRTQQDLDKTHKFAIEKFAKELLSVIDSLELGIQAANSENADIEKLKEGSDLTLKQFEAAFAKFNIEAIDPTGQPFNPELHQAMAMLPNPDVAPNTVINVFQKGYTLNGRLLRPAMVVVAKAE